MTRRRSAVRARVVLGLVAAGGTCFAQDREADAERLFREGQKLLEERRYGEACPKLEAAYHKDGQLGTLMNLAFCHKEQGSIWYAWLEFREAEVMAIAKQKDDRRAFARKQLEELERSLPKVVVDNPQKVPITEILVEDKRVPEADHGAVFTAEPGQRKITFRAVGKKQAVLLVNVVKSEKAQKIAVPAMTDLGPEDLPPPPPPPAPAPPAPPPPPPPRDAVAKPPPEQDPGGTQRTLAYAALGVGAAGVIVGGVTGVMTITNPCATTFRSKGSACDEDPSQERRANTTGLISTIAFAAGATLATTGVVLLVTAPKKKQASHESAANRELRPALGLGWAGMHGTF
jgi:tetratricopeptide (TPR) repeat protein